MLMIKKHASVSKLNYGKHNRLRVPYLSTTRSADTYAACCQKDEGNSLNPRRILADGCPIKMTKRVVSLPRKVLSATGPTDPLYQITSNYAAVGNIPNTDEKILNLWLQQGVR